MPPKPLRAQLEGRKRTDVLATCVAFRIRADDDSLPAMNRLALLELAQRIVHLDAQLDALTTRLARITNHVVPALVAIKGVGLTLPRPCSSPPATTLNA